MNGRVYDPVLGRFLSADPNVDDATDAQGFNRYSYLGNNPLGGTDPSGFFSLKDAAIIVAVIVVSVVTAGAALAAYMGTTFVGAMGTMFGVAGSASMTLGGAIVAGGAGGFASGFAGSLLNGGSIGDAFKAGIIGGVTGAVTAGLTFEAGSLAQANKWNWFERGLAHGAIQGGVTEASGGQFRHGFYAGFATGASEEGIGKWAQGSPAKGITAAAVVGGTASAIGGGKFANGAVSGAFTYLFNYLEHESFKADLAFYDNSDKLTKEERESVAQAAQRYGAKAVGVSSLDEVVEYLKENSHPYDRILLISHGSLGDFGIGDQGLTSLSPQLASIRNLISSNGEMYLMGCLSGGKQSYVDSLAGALNVNNNYHITVYATENFNNIYRNGVNAGIAYQTLHGGNNEKPMAGYPWTKSQ